MSVDAGAVRSLATEIGRLHHELPRTSQEGMSLDMSLLDMKDERTGGREAHRRRSTALLSIVPSTRVARRTGSVFAAEGDEEASRKVLRKMLRDAGFGRDKKTKRIKGSRKSKKVRRAEEESRVRVPLLAAAALGDMIRQLGTRKASAVLDKLMVRSSDKAWFQDANLLVKRYSRFERLRPDALEPGFLQENVGAVLMYLDCQPKETLLTVWESRQRQ